MAIFKQLNGTDRYFDMSARADVIAYVTRPDKAESGFVGGICVDPFDPAESMDQVAAHFNKSTGVQLRHFIISFYPHELDDPEVANEIAQQLILWIGQEYQAVYGVHEDTDLIHIHVVHNSISYIDGHRYYGKKKEYYNLIDYIKALLHQYGIHALEEVSFKSGLNVQIGWE